jgi:glycine oxidase
MSRKQPQIAIIGGGIIGATAAWRLAQGGAAVTLFEKAQLGGEASWAAAGMLSPGGEIGDDTAQPELFIESRSLYRRFVDELTHTSGETIDYQECGAIDLAYSAEEWDALLRQAQFHSRLGIASRELTPVQIKVFSPHVDTKRITGALFYPDDGVVAPRDLMKALRTACRKERVDIRENTWVDGIQVERNAVIIAGARYSSAVLAAGAWSSSIPIEGAPPVPSSEPVRGHLLGYELQLGACPTILRRGRTYVFQRGNGLVVAGASMEHAGFDRQIDEAIVGDLIRKVTDTMPLLGRMAPVDIWTGLRPASERLQLGRWQNTPLFLAYGHYRNGILLAPVTAQRLAEEILGLNIVKSRGMAG